ncbi:hypothetical protein F8388_014107 [Cannabis sativa]|uniref:Uncharacterized protein n=1 Tax=Cannabis sativa TaxID=3483 RepID=A0A7J6GL65_CANSA|nr:hypothetical protein F8388_014107 [Cannabis sativa]
MALTMLKIIYPLFLSSLLIIASANYYPKDGNHNSYHVNYLKYDHLFDHLKPQQTKNTIDPIVGGVIPTMIHTIGIEGVILCHTALNTYIPIQGAVARVTCSPNYSSYDKDDVPSSMLSYESDVNGFFLVKLLVSQLKTGLNVKEDCKVFLEYSPLQTCNLPTDVNDGITGANLSFFTAFKDKVFYTLGAGPLIYTTTPKTDNTRDQYSAPTPGY